MPLPGVKVGPLDPDATAGFGQVSAKHNARTLIRLHRRLHPPALVQALARPIDPERTKALDLDEVRAYLGDLTRESGESLVPEGAEIVGASVGGKSDSEQILRFTFRQPSGRTGKWYASYNEDVLPDSYDAGTELSRIREMKDRGIVSYDSQGTDAEIARRENAGLRREAAALRKQLEAREAAEAGEPVPETPGDSRPDVQILADNERLGREVEELRTRNEALESYVEQHAAGGDAAAASLANAELPDDPAAAEPPFEGYDDLNATEVVKVLHDDGTTHEQREAVLAYEEKHANRKTVVGAAQESLDRGA